jgi:hypothetical protein
MGQSAVRVTGDAISLQIGWRARADLDRAAVREVVRPTWRELPEPGRALSEGYLNLTKPAEPNVLLTLEPAGEVRLVGGVVRRARRLGLCVDDPVGLAAVIRTGE